MSIGEVIGLLIELLTPDGRSDPRVPVGDLPPSSWGRKSFTLSHSFTFDFVPC